MHIEDRIERLEELTEQLLKRIEELEKRERPEEFVTPKQLAETMECSVNTVYIKIRSGEIKAVKIGNAPKIPMSQFYIGNDKIIIPETKELKYRKKESKEKSIKEIVFGKP